MPVLYYRPMKKHELPRGLSGKEPICKAGEERDVCLIPGSGRAPGGGYGNPRQYSCLENPMDRGVWWVTVHRIAESDNAEVTQHTCMYIMYIIY